MTAVAVAVIGYLQFRTARLQWRTAHNRAVLDQFERRYKVYKMLRGLIRAIQGSSDAAHEGFLKAQEAAERAQFLFGDDVVSYVNQLLRDITDLSTVIAERNDGMSVDELKTELEGFLKR